MPTSPEHTHFGERQVRLAEKQGLVDAVFHKVADRYDVMNDLMSFGLHRVWKDILTAKVHPSTSRPFAHLDVAGGTGDVAFRIARAGGRETRVTVADINADMLRVGAERAKRRGLEDRVTFVEANAEDLPLRRRRIRRLYDRLRHPQRAQDREGARRGLSRSPAGRTVPVPRVLAGRPAGSRSGLRRLFVLRDSGDRQGRCGRRRGLPLSGRVRSGSFPPPSFSPT